MDESKLAQQWWDGTWAESRIEDRLYEAGVQYEDIGADYYDSSLELYGVPADFRLSPEQQALIHGFGFQQVYVNHVDKWETHYGWPPPDFRPSAGWRVSYPRNREEGGRSIWVEERVSGWPAEWFDTGYVVIKAPAGKPASEEA